MRSTGKSSSHKEAEKWKSPAPRCVYTCVRVCVCVHMQCFSLLLYDIECLATGPRSPKGPQNLSQEPLELWMPSLKNTGRDGRRQKWTGRQMLQNSSHLKTHKESDLHQHTPAVNCVWPAACIVNDWLSATNVGTLYISALIGSTCGTSEIWNTTIECNQFYITRLVHACENHRITKIIHAMQLEIKHPDDQVSPLSMQLVAGIKPWHEYDEYSKGTMVLCR